ncbi:MAG: signal peptidase II [Chthonomonas sp.]|nr:signal peptidase II [Chthonomonas sp.]
MKRARLFLVISLLFLVLDQVVKAWARGRFQLHESPGFPWPGVFEFTLVYNQGIAFGMMKGMSILFTPVAIAIVVMAYRFVANHPGERVFVHVAAGLVAAGAVGNMIDRIWLGKVTDMFWARFINFPVFNVADVCITIGAVLFGIRFVFERAFAPTPLANPEVAPKVSAE